MAFSSLWITFPLTVLNGQMPRTAEGSTMMWPARDGRSREGEAVALSVEQGFARVAELGGRENFLATLVTMRPDGEPSVAVINAGVFTAGDGSRTVAFVSRGGTTKLANL